MEVEMLPDVTGITVNLCVLEQMYTRGAQRGLLHRGVQIYPQGHGLWWAIYILHFINASVGLFMWGKIIQRFAYISMAERNTMCSWRVIREIDFFFLFLFTLFLLGGSSSSVHQLHCLLLLYRSKFSDKLKPTAHRYIEQSASLKKNWLFTKICFMFIKLLEYFPFFFILFTKL